MDSLDTFVTQHLGAITVTLAVACVALLVAVVLLARRTSGLDRRLRGLTRGEEGQSLEAILEAHLVKVHDVERQVDDLTARSAVLEAVQRKAVQRVGLVRFNPFEDTGGNQSFVLALLDPAGYGVVLNSLHARNQTRLYAKAVQAGATEGALSDEEAEAIRLAGARAHGR